MVNMNPLKDRKQVHAFIVLVNNSRDVWNIKSYLLQPLTTLTPEKVAFQCTDI